MAVIIDGLGQPVNITVAASGVVVCPVASILTGGGGGGSGVTDHGALTGLADDDHTQYHTDARGDARYSQLGHNHDHGNLTGLADDDHPQYLNNTRGDIRYALINHGHAASAVSVTASGFAGNLSPADTNVQLALATLDALDVSGSGAVAALTAATGEPMGHKDRTESVISFDNSSRTFTIAPVGTTYEVWCAGTKYDLTTQSVTIPNTTGLYYISFTSTGTLQYTTTYFDWPNETPTAYVYWNQTTAKAEFFADERHGIVLDWATHEYLHRTRGAAMASGFSLSGYTLAGTGGADADAQASLSSGTFFDEDLQVDVVATATPTANSWEQNLLFPMKVPVFYLDGTAWRADTPTNFPLKTGTARARYNLLTGSTWSTADAGNSDYVVSWLVATNNLNYPVMVILGQASYNSLPSAWNALWESLTLTNFPVFEFRPLYKLIFQTATSYTNTPHARLRDVQDIRGSISVGSGTTTSDHGLLNGLADDDHLQYALADGSRGAFVPTSRTITAGTGLTGGGDLSADRTLAVSFGTTSSTVMAGNDPTADFESFSNTAYTSNATRQVIIQQEGTLSAPRIVTLPYADSLPPGSRVVVNSGAGCTTTNYIQVTARAGETINATLSSFQITTAFASRILYTDGVAWWADPSAIVTRVFGGQGAGSGVAITATPASILSSAITVPPCAAGDLLIVEGSFTINNNSTASRTYTGVLKLGATSILTFTLGSQAVATRVHAFQAYIRANTTTSQSASANLVHNTVAGTSGVAVSCSGVATETISSSLALDLTLASSTGTLTQTGTLEHITVTRIAA